ncbi:hypothetical protein ASG01_15445 [Chryseobacterium sp. Leaf180]|nr:hypothetical protein ASG01_15445 [Chryseobacterium sp. Leaf180]
MLFWNMCYSRSFSAVAIPSHIPAKWFSLLHAYIFMQCSGGFQRFFFIATKEIIKNKYKEVEDCSTIYMNYNDLNDWYCNQ